LSLLTQTKKIFGVRFENLTTKINNLNESIIKLYKTLDETTWPAYNLSSILIHEGSASYGHYFSYIYDPYKKIWRRFSDLQVSEMEEKEVMEKALGKGTTNAYCLIYVKDGLSQNKSKLPFMHFGSSFLESKQSEECQCLYECLVSEKVKG
jgi:ubiquitin carboxyl-terminal hydrolase 25/28